MKPRASIGVALLALSHLAFAGAPPALAQAGSTGGTISGQGNSAAGAGDAGSSPAAAPTRSRSAPAGSASAPARPQSTETPQQKFANDPTCTNVRLACEKTASKFGVTPGRGPCASSFAECMKTGKWKSNFSYYEGLARR